MVPTTDPIADMLSRIRNAIAVRKFVVSMPHSKTKESVARILAENNFIDKVDVEPARIGKTLVVTIANEQSNARITEVSRLSKPGRRYYVRASDIPVIKRGRGIVVLSTSKGMMTGGQAKQAGIGGEIICQIY